MSLRCWASSLKQAGAPDHIIKSWHALRAAVAKHQKLLAENGIGKEVSERDRIRVNARRVGLEAPMFADEAEGSFSDILNAALSHRHKHQRTQHDQQEGSQRQDLGTHAQVN